MREVKARKRAEGVRLVATDSDWSVGQGPEVRGPGEAILMTITGRRGVIDELSGPGVAVLANRACNAREDLRGASGWDALLTPDLPARSHDLTSPKRSATSSNAARKRRSGMPQARSFGGRKLGQ